MPWCPRDGRLFCLDSRVQHALETLGPTGFQDLAASLAMAEFGARLIPLGAGRDGGRDMYYEGSLDWTGRSRATEPADTPPLAAQDRAALAAPLGHPDVWLGYTVFQVKHHTPLAAQPIENARWLWTQMRGELEAWTKPDSKRARTPDHLVFVTNVPLSPDPIHGGWTHIEKGLDGYRENLEDNTRDTGASDARLRQLSRLNRIKHIRVIDGTTTDMLISVNDGVRRSFSALLTVGDVFASLGELIGFMDDSTLFDTLLRHAKVTMSGDRQIAFDEAGAPAAGTLAIDDVAIDLPITTGSGQDETLVSYVLDRGDRILHPRATLHQGPRHLVVTGPMGNGKTTMSKLLVQAYRASLLKGNTNLGQSAAAAIDGIEDRLKIMGREGLPRHRRWPMRVDLAAFAEEEGQTEKSLLRHIADLISTRTTHTVKPAHVDTWMRRWPWFLILDGLDEVTEPQTRRSVIRRVMELVDGADNDDLDLFVVMTTRPVGYTENIAPRLFEQVDLGPLPLDVAVRYGRSVTRARLGEDHEAIPRVDRGLDRAAAAENTRELMVTPLQMLILTVIIESSGPLPPDRFALFWGFYDAVSKRERIKLGSLKEILDAHLDNITILHERIGYELHLRSQLSENATSTMSSEELRDLIADVLRDDGHDPDGVDRELVEAIRKACLQRLLLIRAHKDGVGFDVRALQELMAGRHLSTGPDEVVTSRLRNLAAHPHWRIPWIFAAGRVFADSQPHRRDQVVAIVREVDEGAEWRLGRVSPVGPGLALDLAVDGGARKHPRVRKPLLDHAVTLFDAPAPADPRATTRLLLRAAGASPEARLQVSAALRVALGGTASARATAVAVQELMRSVAGEVSASDDVRMLAVVKSAGPTGRSDAPEPDRWWDEALARVEDSRVRGVEGAEWAARALAGLYLLRPAFTPEATAPEQWEEAARALRDRDVPDGLEGVRFEVEVRGPILVALDKPAAAALLEALLLDLPFQDPDTVIRLRDWVLAVRLGVAWEDEQLD